MERPLAWRRLCATTGLIAMLVVWWVMRSPPIDPVVLSTSCRVVLVPGFQGSILVDGRGETVWPPGPQALLTGDAPALEPERRLAAVDVIRQVDVLPPLLSVDVYGPLIDDLEQAGCSVTPFPWDWRLPLEVGVAEYLRLRARPELHGAVVVTHSLGGLVHHAARELLPDDVVIHIAVPFGSGAGFVDDVSAGSPLGPHRRFLPASLLQSLPGALSVFAPDDPRLSGADPFASTTWLPSASGEALASARTFRARLSATAGSTEHFIIGTGQSTVAATTRQTDGRWQVTSTSTAGDGRVLAADAVLPGAAPGQVLDVQGVHSRLVTLPAVRRFVVETAHASARSPRLKAGN